MVYIIDESAERPSKRRCVDNLDGAWEASARSLSVMNDVTSPNEILQFGFGNAASTIEDGMSSVTVEEESQDLLESTRESAMVYESFSFDTRSFDLQDLCLGGFSDPSKHNNGEIGEVEQCKGVGDAVTSEIICFGMVSDIPLTIPDKSRFEATFSTRVPVKFGARGVIRNAENREVLGQVEEPATTALRALLEEDGIELQLVCNVERSHSSPRRAKKDKVILPFVVSLSATIYGPISRFEDIGDYLQSCEFYLQDPQHCDRNVRYRNPHRLSGLDEDAPMTMDIVEGHGAHQEETETPVDLLADVECEIAIPEAPKPPGLATRLHSHQSQALSFMLRREQGWALRGSYPDIWRAEPSSSGGRMYINNVTGEPHLEVPVEFRGGILADDMGLGKTLSMISLIAHDKAISANLPVETPLLAGHNSVKSTLVVVPVSLLSVWELQLSRHLQPNTITWHKHHGNRRVKNPSSFSQNDVIITTYETIASEWKRQGVAGSSILSTHWRRLVLDEAHYIRGRNTVRAKAICAIQAHCRWAISGTPIQNSLMDLASLLQYLRVFPYDDPRVFDAHITDLWKAHGEEEALERLKRLIKAIALRRSRATLQLPERHNVIRYLNFAAEEEAKYKSTEAPIIDMLEHALSSDHNQTGLYLNALQKINALRMLCNLGTFTRPGPEKPSSSLETENIVTEGSPPGRLGTPRSPDALLCPECSLGLGPADDMGLFKTVSSSLGTPLSPSSLIICDNCLRPCGDESTGTAGFPSSPMDPESTLCSDSDILTPEAGASEDTPCFPTKVATLVSDIQKLPAETKAVVFSFWTSTLQLIENALDTVSIKHVRFDGQVSSKSRIMALSRFRDEPDIQIILVSISCGAVGLDLTAASHVFLMEPQWNPTMEEQALSRVYRMGQTKEVSTIRYIMQGSFEEHVIKVQNKKKHLADLLLSQTELSNTDASRNQLQHLRSLLG